MGMQVDYVNVKKDPAALARMLALSKGDRTVPVIERGGAIEVGWEGKG
jgi:hypothetical protein